MSQSVVNTENDTANTLNVRSDDVTPVVGEFSLYTVIVHKRMFVCFGIVNKFKTQFKFFIISVLSPYGHPSKCNTRVSLLLLQVLVVFIFSHLPYKAVVNPSDESSTLVFHLRF